MEQYFINSPHTAFFTHCCFFLFVFIFLLYTISCASSLPCYPFHVIFFPCHFLFLIFFFILHLSLSSWPFHSPFPSSHSLLFFPSYSFPPPPIPCYPTYGCVVVCMHTNIAYIYLCCTPVSTFYSAFRLFRVLICYSAYILQYSQLGESGRERGEGEFDNYYEYVGIEHIH